MQKIEDIESNDNTNTDEEMTTSKTKYLARKIMIDDHVKTFIGMITPAPNWRPPGICGQVKG